MAYAEIKKAPLDLAARASGPIDNPRLALRQLPRLASRHFGGVAAAGLTVLRFGPPLPAPPPGAIPPCEPEWSRSRQQRGVGSRLLLPCSLWL